jgi:hypothetical protein
VYYCFYASVLTFSDPYRRPGRSNTSTTADLPLVESQRIEQDCDAGVALYDLSDLCGQGASVSAGIRIDADSEAALSPCNPDIELEHCTYELNDRGFVRCLRHPRTRGFHTRHYSKPHASTGVRPKRVKRRRFFVREKRQGV